MTNSPKTTNRLAAERHCDLMKQGFMKGSPVAPYSEAELRSAREYAARILAKIDARSELAVSL